MKFIKHSRVVEKVSLDVIADACCEYFSLTKQELFINTRKSDIVVPRQWFHYLSVILNDRFSCSYAWIGNYSKEINGRVIDHATVLNSFRQVSNHVHTSKRDLRMKQELLMLVNKHIEARSKPLGEFCATASFSVKSPIKYDASAVQ